MLLTEAKDYRLVWIACDKYTGCRALTSTKSRTNTAYNKCITLWSNSIEISKFPARSTLYSTECKSHPICVHSGKRETQSVNWAQKLAMSWLFLQWHLLQIPSLLRHFYTSYSWCLNYSNHTYLCWNWCSRKMKVKLWCLSVP